VVQPSRRDDRAAFEQNDHGRVGASKEAVQRGCSAAPSAIADNRHASDRGERRLRLGVCAVGEDREGVGGRGVALDRRERRSQAVRLSVNVDADRDAPGGGHRSTIDRPAGLIASTPV